MSNRDQTQMRRDADQDDLEMLLDAVRKALAHFDRHFAMYAPIHVWIWNLKAVSDRIENGACND